MVYQVGYDSFTKIAETSGTIQNIKGGVIEMSNNQNFNNGILISPHSKCTFSNENIYLRCVEQGFTAEVRVVPFSLDVRGGESSGVDENALKAVDFAENALKFYTSTDTAQAAAYTVNLPAEQFIDQAATNFVPNFSFSGILYPNATNPNLDGKPVLVLGVKTKNNGGTTETISYSFIDLSSLLDTYTASDTSVVISDYKVKANVSPDSGNALKLKANGLYADGITDTATASTFGLTKLYNGAGASTDGAITQAAITELLNSKASTDTATTSAAGLMASTDKAKLDGIEDDAQVNIVETIKVDGNALSIQNKSVNIDLSGKLDSDANAVSATKAYQDSAGNVITDTYLTKSDATDTYVSRVEFNHKINAVRYGYRISKTEPDPYLRVEYLYDAAGMRPAKMVFDTDTSTAGTDSDTSYFDYGDWQSVWFVRDNKPLMLKSDGTVDYYLDPNDYTKRETPLEVTDGTDTVIVTDTDIANTSYDGNAMAQFPLCWVKRYEDDEYYYEIISNVQYDENYKAYAHTDATGTIKPYFYHAIFEGSNISNKARSLAGQTPNTFRNTNETNMRTLALANGSNWDFCSWSQWSLFRTLHTLISKTCDSQTAFGYGSIRAAGMNETNKILNTGLLTNKGQFFGFQDFTKPIKTFHMENTWGNSGERLMGFTFVNCAVYVKMTPEGSGYRVANPQGYTYLYTLSDSSNGGYVREMTCNEYGMIPKSFDGSSSTFFCDTESYTNNLTGDVIAGGTARGMNFDCGIWNFQGHLAPNWTSAGHGCGVSYV